MGLPDLLLDGPTDAPLTIALAHGAGAPMDSAFMQVFAEGLAVAGFRVARFEFPYMNDRRETGIKKPPNRAPVLLETWRAVINELGPDNLIIGGKSMGGRIASMVADDTGVRGLVCLGYPFRPPGKDLDPGRIEHLTSLRIPTLICQGARDRFGGIEDVPQYPLSDAIKVQWLEDGDHGFKPRKASGLTEPGNWQQAIAAIATFAGDLSHR